VLAWVKFVVKEHKAIASFVIFIMSIAGVSIYGNVNEINPWKPTIKVVEEEVEVIEKEVHEITTPVPQVKIIEKTIETRTGITKLQVDAAVDAFMTEHIREYD